jgi:uncharacterized protein with ParB-like and HNH nuclease domain
LKTELITVSRIFTESLYRIPDYQRGYAWGLEQLADFWLDLEQLGADAKHYTGVLTLEEVPEQIWTGWDKDSWIIKSRRFKPYFVVDGQQRLTTIVVLLTVLLELERPAHLNFTSRDDVRRKYIYDSKPEDAARSYIFGYAKDNPSYEFLKTQIFLEPSEVHLPFEQTIYTKNLQQAKDFFQEKVLKLNDSEVERLYTKVTQQLVFNAYEISTEIDVFVAFETMNNRGKPLSTLELLKNRLIYLSSKLSAPPDRENTLRRNLNDAWKSAYHFIGKNDDRPLNDDAFLRTHLSYYYLTSLTNPSVFNDEDRDTAKRKYEVAIEYYSRFLLNDLFTPKRLGAQSSHQAEAPALTREFLHEFAQELKTNVELYYKLSTPIDSKWGASERMWLERINRLLGYSPAALLLALYRRESKSEKRVAFLEEFERFNFLVSLGGRTPYQFTRRFWAPDYLVKYSLGDLNTDELTTQIGNLTKELLRESSLAEALHDWVKVGGGYYGWRSIKYFLFEYETSLQASSKSGREKVDWDVFSEEDYKTDYETVEHIYPQKARDKYWTDRFSKFNTTHRRLLRNSLGNLLPLAKPRNSSLGNRAFPDKLGSEASKEGYRYGCYSENEVALRPEWSAKEIADRGIRLLEFLEKRWKLQIGDRKSKLHALGLDFMD